MLTREELCAKILEQYDADLLLEILQISAEEILERFDDKIELHWFKLEEAIDDE